MEAHAAGQNEKTFFDSEIHGISVQANATAETQPEGNLTVWLRVKLPQDSTYNVSVQLLQFEVIGFMNDTVEISIGNITGANVSLKGTETAEYSGNFSVPDWVSGATFGSIMLTNIDETYPSPGGSSTTRISSATGGFYMTSVENTYLKSLESQNEDLETQIHVLNESVNVMNDTYNNLRASYVELNQNYNQLTENYSQLNQNYTTLRGSMNELDNTREVAVILGITTVFFVASTILMIVRRPRERW